MGGVQQLHVYYIRGTYIILYVPRSLSLSNSKSQKVDIVRQINSNWFLSFHEALSLYILT